MYTVRCSINETDLYNIDHSAVIACSKNENANYNMHIICDPRLLLLLFS